MLSIQEAMIALLDNAPDLTKAIGHTYETQTAEIWNVPPDVTYPLLAIAFSGARDSLNANVDDPSTFPEDLRMKCWYEADTILDVTAFRDALRVKLHKRQYALQNQGIAVTQIEMRDSNVGSVPGAAHFQAYCEFALVA